MWNPAYDLRNEEQSLRDVPCNLTIAFGNCSGRLNMTVFCRSNDLVLGAMGTNVVCLSMLQEYVAAMIGWEVGTYRQVSVNLHAYLDTFDKVRECVAEADYSYPKEPWIYDAGGYPVRPVNPESYASAVERSKSNDPYTHGEVEPYPMVIFPGTWDRDLVLFLEDPTTNGCEDPFWAHVAKPLWWAHAAYSKRSDPDRFKKAREILVQCRAEDWGKAALEWISRRERFTKAG